ncbi:hypothetical protein ACWD25_49790, partial [Streptomyces sp. NPDC002920]
GACGGRAAAPCGWAAARWTGCGVPPAAGLAPCEAPAPGRGAVAAEGPGVCDGRDGDAAEGPGCDALPAGG